MTSSGEIADRLGVGCPNITADDTAGASAASTGGTGDDAASSSGSNAVAIAAAIIVVLLLVAIVVGVLVLRARRQDAAADFKGNTAMSMANPTFSNFTVQDGYARGNGDGDENGGEAAYQIVPGSSSSSGQLVAENVMYDALADNITFGGGGDDVYDGDGDGGGGDVYDAYAGSSEVGYSGGGRKGEAVVVNETYQEVEVDLALELGAEAEAEVHAGFGEDEAGNGEGVGNGVAYAIVDGTNC